MKEKIFKIIIGIIIFILMIIIGFSLTMAIYNIIKLYEIMR